MTYEMRTGTKDHWDEIIASLPGTHIMQSWNWGEVKRFSGWEPIHKIWRDEDEKIFAAALILTRVISLKGMMTPLRIMYLPRGPLVHDWKDQALVSQVFADLHKLGRKHRVIFIKIDPEVELGRGIPGTGVALVNPFSDLLIEVLRDAHWIPSVEQVQFRNTMLIDLHPDQDQLLANMKQKTRYNIRLARKRGVKIRAGSMDDLDLLFHMYAETSVRDGFTIRNADYYLSLWGTFINAGIAEPLLAEVDGKPVAGVIIFHLGDRAWYMYGMSREAHREKMPNYLLQWEAMVRAKSAGCVVYDLWGAPDEFVESDGMWGVYRFKAGLGAEVVRFIGAWDLPLNKFMYRVYSQFIPRLLDIMRRRGEAETQGVVQAG